MFSPFVLRFAAQVYVLGCFVAKGRNEYAVYAFLTTASESGRFVMSDIRRQGRREKIRPNLVAAIMVGAEYVETILPLTVTLSHLQMHLAMVLNTLQLWHCFHDLVGGLRLCIGTDP